ncbi:MAG: glutamate racemase [Vampirovibrionia bacterium]
MKRAIGIFDSGVGGLTVVKELINSLPNENILYFGDIARVPYGSKTPDEIITIVREIIDWMLGFDVKAVAMACNTSSALALEIVKKEYRIPIYGLIKPTSNYINSLENVKKIGVIATEATVKSQAYSKAINKYRSDIQVIETACPGLVEIIESGQINTPAAQAFLKNHLDPMIKENVDKIILGCTHYPFAQKVITSLYNREDLLINPARFMVKEIQETLSASGILNGLNANPERQFYVSASPIQFAKVGSTLLPDILTANNVKVELLGEEPMFQNVAV